MSTRKAHVKNHLIESLPIEVRNELFKQFTLVDWKFGEVVCEANQRYEHIYFPVTGFISLLTMEGDHHPLEMGLIGNEGMLGVSLALGVNKPKKRS